METTLVAPTLLILAAGALAQTTLIPTLGGGIFPLAIGIVRDEFPRERVAGSIGLLSAIAGIGGGLGLVLGGVLSEAIGFNALVRSVGASLGAQVSAALIAGSGDGFTTAWLVGAAVALLAGMVALAIPAPRRHEVEPADASRS